MDILTNAESSQAFKKPTTCVKQLWQADFNYFKIVGWRWYYRASVLEDFSRCTRSVTWTLTPTILAPERQRRRGHNRCAGHARTCASLGETRPSSGAPSAAVAV